MALAAGRHWKRLYFAGCRVGPRYHWSAEFSLPAELLGLCLILTGYVITPYAFIEKAFFSGTVRIQAERGHKVVSSGPYAWVRHPDCRGSLVASLEDRFLQKNLPGYRQYAQKVRFRLLPGVWRGIDTGTSARYNIARITNQPSVYY